MVGFWIEKMGTYEQFRRFNKLQDTLRSNRELFSITKKENFKKFVESTDFRTDLRYL